MLNMVGSAYYGRHVYVLCRPIFSGNNARVRKSKKVKELVIESSIAMKIYLIVLPEEDLN